MAEPNNDLNQQMANLTVSSPTSVTPPSPGPSEEELTAAIDEYVGTPPPPPPAPDLTQSTPIAGETGTIMGVPYYSPVTVSGQQRVGAVTGTKEITMDKFGPMGFVTKRENILDRSKMQNFVTVQEAFKTYGTPDENVEKMIMRATGFTYKDMDADPLPDGSYPTKKVKFIGPANYETRLREMNAGRALTLEFSTSSGKKAPSYIIPYSAITEQYLEQPADIDAWLKMNLPGKDSPEDEGYFDIAVTSGMNDETSRAIFAKRFVEYWRKRGMSERNIAGILKNRISLGRPLGDVRTIDTVSGPVTTGFGSDIGAYGDAGLIASAPTQIMRFAFDAGTFLLGEALEVALFGMDLEGYSTFGYNLSTPEGREAAGDRILPRTETLLKEHYDSLNLDVSYAQAEALSRFFTSPASALIEVAIAEKGASKFATYTKTLSGKREKALFEKYRKEMEAKHPDSDPEDIIIGFQNMRKQHLDLPFADTRITFKSDKIYDGILKVPLLGRPLAEVVDKVVVFPIAKINGLRTSSAMKAGMQLEEAALSLRDRPRVRQFIDYRRGKINERASIRRIAAEQNRSVSAGEQARIDELTRQIDRSQVELRAVIARSELPEFMQGQGLDAAIIVGSATGNTIAQNYGGDVMLWEFISGMGGMGLYGMSHSGSAVTYVRDMIRGQKDGSGNRRQNFKDMHNAMKLGKFLINVPNEFREGMMARARYFDSLKQSLAAEGVPSELLDRSAANIFKLSLLQTLEEGMRINLDAPGTAQFKDAQMALQETLNQQTLLVSELRGLFQRLSRATGAEEEGTAANKLYTTVQAALEHGEGKIKQLDADMQYIDANFAEVTFRRIEGHSDALSIALTPDAEKNWDSTLQRLFNDGVSIVSPQDLAKKGDTLRRKHQRMADVVVAKAAKIATSLLPSADRAKKTAGIALPPKLLENVSTIEDNRKGAVLPVFDRPEDIMALGFETARAAARENASLPYKSLNGQIFRNPETDLPIVGDTFTDAGGIFDGVMKALGKVDNVELEQALNPNGVSTGAMNKLVRSLGAAAEGALSQLAKAKGFESVDAAIESAENAAKEAERYDEFFAKNIPPALSAVNYLRTINKERGVDIEMMPLDFLQAKELREALGGLSFKATKGGNTVAAAEYQGLADLTTRAMSNFVVLGEDGTRTRAGDLIATVTLPDGTKQDMTVANALAVADRGWTDYKNRYDGNPIVSEWMGINRFEDEPRVAIEPSADFPLGMNYGKNPTSSWFDVTTWAGKTPQQAEADFRFVERAIGRKMPDGTYRVDISTPDGRMFKESLGAIYRDWVLKSLEEGKLSFKQFDDLSRDFESRFRAVDADGNVVQMIDTDRMFRDLTKFSPDAVGDMAFANAQKAMRKTAQEQTDEIKRQTNVIREGVSKSVRFLQQYSSEKLDVKNLADEIINGGPVRIQQLKRHLTTVGRMGEDDANLMLRSVLMEAIEQRAFKPTGSFIANVNPDATRSSRNLAQKLTQEYDADMGELSRLLGYGDTTIGPMIEEIVGEKAYKTYTDVLQFMSDQKTRREAGVKFTGIPREFSVESYISRFYAVNRGVVSFRYVGTEAVLQSMRQNNMSMLHQIIGNPRVGELFLEMVRTGKPLPFEKEVEFRKLLIIGYERYMSTKSPEPLTIQTSEGHVFEFQDQSYQGTQGAAWAARFNRNPNPQPVGTNR